MGPFGHRRARECEGKKKRKYKGKEAKKEVFCTYRNNNKKIGAYAELSSSSRKEKRKYKEKGARKKCFVPTEII